MEESYIAEIVSKDPPSCRHEFENSKKRRIKPFAKKKALPVQSTEASTIFPLGQTPTYCDLQDFLANAKEPWTIMRNCNWTEGFDHTLSEVAVNLFIIFTREMMNCLNLENMRGACPDPKDLREAMDIWMVKSLSLHISHPHFVASNYGLRGVFKGPRDKPPWHLDVFFPKNEKGLVDSNWKPFLKLGYLKKYFKFKTSVAP